MPHALVLSAVRVFAIVALSSLAANVVNASVLKQSRDSAICDSAAKSAALRYDVPEATLLAITRIETGRSQSGALVPWPWAVNIGGKGYWFQTNAAAQTFLFNRFRAGARNFDVGCFQINYRWHHAQFRSIEEMFDPQANADYAARFLKTLYAEFGNWADAAGAYHSRTERHSKQYTAKFRDVSKRLSDEKSKRDDAPQARTLAQSGTSLPLVLGVHNHLGSLVPVEHRTNQPFILLN